MTVADQLPLLDRKIKQNEAQDDWDNKAAKISTCSSNNLDKYEYLSGEDLDYKPDAADHARFEYSTLGKIFNKGLTEEDKKEGLLKRLRNIEGKDEEQLKATEDQGKKQLDAIKDTKTKLKPLKAILFLWWVKSRGKKTVRWAKKGKSTIDFEKLVCVKTDGTIFNFNTFKNSPEFLSNMYHKGKTSLEDAKKSQYRMFSLLNNLKE